MAQLVKYDRAQVLKKAGVHVKLLRSGDSGKKDMVIVSGKDLAKECPEAWQNNSETAEFLGGNLANPGNSGTCDVTELISNLDYEVFYIMAMKDEDVTSKVTLALQLPNGITKKQCIDLTVKQGDWQAVSVGKFLNTFSSGNIKFSFSGEIGDTWKGLLIQEVVVAHPNK